ncbi:MAG TPA: helix-turn-helix domain-containing protein [Nocardioidaceae bacterium]|nr:helix-turn-helix domain-containing protein [Nocardioidaceae bacterium]
MSDRAWEPPSPTVAALVVRAAQTAMEFPADLLADLDEAVLEANRELLEIEPRLADSFKASVRGVVTHWVSANIRAPGHRVRADLDPDTLALARDIVRHGFDGTLLSGHRAAQNAALLALQEIAFQVTDDPSELRELLDVLSRSVFALIDDTLAGIDEHIRQERHQLTDATHVARLETLSLIVQGAPISERRATERLRYDLSRQHLAGILWSEGEPRLEELESTAQALAREAGAAASLSLPGGPSTLWIWISGKAAPDLGQLTRLTAPPDTFLALGRPAGGLDGFRRTHLEALAAQRLVRRLPTRTFVTAYDDVEVVALATQDESKAADFVQSTLGELAQAPSELRETLRTYLREQCSPTRTANVLFAHRNTVMARLDRARALLPRGLDGNTLPVGLALEIARFGAGGLSAS